MQILRKLWAGWMAFAHVLGKIQTSILLTLVYVVAIGPIALVSRLIGSDLLGLRRTDGPSHWSQLPEVTSSIERATKQF